MNGLIPVNRIEQRILRLRGQNVMLDEDLAQLYGVETKVLNRAVKRNRERFPEDFMFQLLPAEVEALRCQSGTSSLRSQFGTSKGHGGRRYLFDAFTEQGVAVPSSVLRSKRGVYPLLDPRFTSTNHELVFDAIRKLMEPPVADAKRRIGFRG
jgi:hypothetical protein